MEYHGTYEKDGKVYEKYLKTRRFPRLSRRKMTIALIVVFASLLASVFVWLALQNYSAPPSETTGPIPGN